MRKVIYSDEAPKPLGRYSQGVVAGGLILVFGQLPIDPKTNKFLKQEIKNKLDRYLKI